MNFNKSSKLLLAFLKYRMLLQDLVSDHRPFLSSSFMDARKVFLSTMDPETKMSLDEIYPPDSMHSSNNKLLAL